MNNRLSDYDYPLPRELVAARPLANRDQSRLMIVDRRSESIEHRHFRELADYVGADDVLVLNDTKVLPAQIFSDDGSIQLLLLERLDRRRWRCFTKPGKKTRIGSIISIGGTDGQIEAVNEQGERIINLSRDVNLYASGSMPIPPYLRRPSDAEDVMQYQTVFARNPGAVAAPTAGLHFTSEMLAHLPHVCVTLHVGPGTFRPVHSEDITAHRMHREQYWISDSAARTINEAKRVIAVGTTTVRVLESACDSRGDLQGTSGSTDIFIYPPFGFKISDALVTNFHLPRSTLLMLVSAFAGRELVLRAYAEAVKQQYRFFSYGDAMLVL